MCEDETSVDVEGLANLPTSSGNKATTYLTDVTINHYPPFDDYCIVNNDSSKKISGSFVNKR